MDTSAIRKGLKILLDGQPYIVVEFQFVKPGKGQAFTRTKLKNMLTGGNIERNLRSSEKLEPADVEDRTLQYIYPDGEMYVFMNSNTGEQLSVHKDAVGQDADFLIDGIDATITIYNGNPVSISGFPATRGWDPATGLGTPKANTLVPLLGGRLP